MAGTEAGVSLGSAKTETLIHNHNGLACHRSQESGDGPSS